MDMAPTKRARLTNSLEDGLPEQARQLAGKAMDLAEEALRQSRAKLEERELEVGRREQEVRRARADLRAEREALDEERRAMAGGRTTDDVLTLNLGGERLVSTQRGTLCAAEGSMLAKAFSGRWDDGLTKDKDGNFFIDWPAQVVMPLLSALRQLRMTGRLEPPSPAALEGCEQEWVTMLAYYALDDMITGSPMPLKFRFEDSPELLQDNKVRLSDDRMRATSASGQSWIRVFGAKTINRQIMGAPLTFTFMVVSWCNTTPRTKQYGPNVGVECGAAADDGLDRSASGVWAYRITDGQLLAPTDADVVGASTRTPALPGDVLTFTIFPDGRMALAKNKDDLGAIFQNLPGSFRHVVEMFAPRQEVMVMI